MSRRPHLRQRLDALFGGDLVGARQSLIALCLNSTTSLVAGAFLGSITGPPPYWPSGMKPSKPA